MNALSHTSVPDAVGMSAQPGFDTSPAPWLERVFQRVAEQEMSADDDRTVGQAVADAIAEPLAAMAAAISSGWANLPVPVKRRDEKV